jgi:ribose 1,5-bisphosphokinase
MTARYAIYNAPETTSAWWHFGSCWLGRCAATGESRAQPRIEGVDASVLAECTAAPRRYGFHATLKPPFRLAPGTRLDELVRAVERFCARQKPLPLALAVTEMNGFLALVPPARDARLDALAAACVRGLDRFRAPSGAGELAIRRGNGLSRREEELLRRWGYPYVMDRFRFHLSLTGDLRSVAPPVVAGIRAAAEAAVNTLAREPLWLDAVCIFEEAHEGAALRIVHRAPFGIRGRLIYVVGPSGAGKDSLLDWLRARMPPSSGLRLARRTVTRAAGAGGENHVAATEEQFEAALARGEFAMHWRANGYRYGIAREIKDWLAAGHTVLVNGSREYLPVARARFPQLEAVHIVASPAVLRSRLALRARELPKEAAARLERSVALAQAVGPAALVLANDGPIDLAGERLAAFLTHGG